MRPKKPRDSGGGNSRICTTPPGARRTRLSATRLPVASKSRARVRVGSTRRRIIWRPSSGMSSSPSATESMTAPSPSAAAKISPCVLSAGSSVSIRLDSYSPRKRRPMPSSARARTLTARMRRVSGEMRRRGRGGAPAWAAAPEARGAPPAAAGTAGAVRLALAVAVPVSDAIERLDLCELVVDDLELLAQPLDVTVDRPVVDIDMLAIGGVHQLVAAFDVALARRQRFEDEELGDGELDRPSAPGAEMAPGIEHEIAALDHRLAVARVL